MVIFTSSLILFIYISVTPILALALLAYCFWSIVSLMDELLLIWPLSWEDVLGVKFLVRESLLSMTSARAEGKAWW